MKRGAKLAVLTAALAVLVAAWLLAESMTRNREEQQAIQAAAEPVDLAVGAYGDVTALSWDYLGNTVRLALQDGVWVNADDGACPIDQDAVTPLIQAVSDTSASDTIEAVTDFDQYGLAQPAITVQAAAGAHTVTYAIGNMTAAGEYYVRVDDGDTVYTETGLLAPAFEAQIGDLLALETVPSADIAQITALAVQTKGESYTIEYRADGSASAFTDEYTWFLTDGAENDGEASGEPVDGDETQSLCKLVTGVQLSACVDWNAQDLSKYGLDDPQGIARVTYVDRDENSRGFALMFGDYTDDGSVYTRLADSRMVYLVSGTVLDGLMHPDREALVPMNISPMNWAWLDSFTIEREKDTAYEIIRAVSTPMADGEEPENIYTLGDRSLDAARVDSWLGAVHDLTADSAAQSAAGREEILKLTFRQDNEAFPEVTLAFWAYDSAHCLCAVNGQDYYLVSRTAVSSLWDEAEEFLLELPET